MYLGKHLWCWYSKTRLKQPLKNRQNKGLKDQLWLNAGKNYCRMLQGVKSDYPLMQIKSIAECSPCNTFVLH